VLGAGSGLIAAGGADIALLLRRVERRHRRRSGV
jgi:hypothetical protein